MKNNTKKIISLILAAAILSGCTSGVAEDRKSTRLNSSRGRHNGDGRNCG